MKKKLSILLVVALAFSLVFSGCGNSSDEVVENVEGQELSEEIPSGDITLKVWGPEEDAAILENVASGFKEKYGSQANFDIQIEYCSEADCKAQMIADINNGADVFTFADDQLNILAASGILKAVDYNLDEVTSRNSEGSVNAASVNGSLYAYPLTADNGYFLYYNKEYFTDADLTTMDSVLAVCAANGKKMTFDVGNAWYFYSFFGNTGLELGLNDDGISNYCTWNGVAESGISGIDVMNAVMAVCANPGFLNGGDAVLNEGAANGTVIAGVSGVWDTTTLQEAWGDNLGAVKLPTYTVAGQQIQMSSYAGYKMVGVNAYSPNHYWAEVFADYMTNEDSQNFRFQARQQGPTNTNAAASPEVGQAVAIQALIQQSEFARLQRVGAAYWSAVADFGADLNNQTTRGLDPQEYLDSVVAKITASNT